MTIYLDVIWFLNFCIDLLLIWMTAFALKRPLYKWRFLLAALIASTVVLFLFTPLAFLFYKPWAKLLFSTGIVWIAFGFKRPIYLIQNLLMFYFVTFMTGGGLFAFHFFWKTEVEILDGIMMSKTTGFGSTFSWIFVVIGIPLMYYFSRKQLETMETRKLNYERIVNVIVTIEGIQLKASGLIDSGNQLTDPITKTPVMILEKDIIQEGFPNINLEKLIDFDHTGMNAEAQDEHVLMKRMRIIPYRVVGKENNFLVAIKPDLVTVYDGDEKYEVKKVLIGLESMKLSNDSDFQAIVHPKMLIGGQGKKLA